LVPHSHANSFYRPTVLDYRTMAPVGLNAVPSWELG
jgi:hypothetical protein